MDWVKGNFYTSNIQRQNNAVMVRNWLNENDPGWTMEAMAALLANLEQESGINPGIWENLKPGKGGWGLVQWTPARNYTNWAHSNGWADDSGNGQMTWIRDQTIPSGQWITTSAYPISFQEFKKSTRDPAWLTVAWCKNFERGVLGDRVQYASKWYEFLGGHPGEIDPGPNPDEPWYPTPSEYRKHMPIYMYFLPWS